MICPYKPQTGGAKAAPPSYALGPQVQIGGGPMYASVVLRHPVGTGESGMGAIQGRIMGGLVVGEGQARRQYGCKRGGSYLHWDSIPIFLCKILPNSPQLYTSEQAGVDPRGTIGGLAAYGKEYYWTLNLESWCSLSFVSFCSSVCICRYPLLYLKASNLQHHSSLGKWLFLTFLFRVGKNQRALQDFGKALEISGFPPPAPHITYLLKLVEHN